jgi:hypothetical protein
LFFGQVVPSGFERPVSFVVDTDSPQFERDFFDYVEELPVEVSFEGFCSPEGKCAVVLVACDGGPSSEYFDGVDVVYYLRVAHEFVECVEHDFVGSVVAHEQVTVDGEIIYFGGAGIHTLGIEQVGYIGSLRVQNKRKNGKKKQQKEEKFSR